MDKQITLGKTSLNKLKFSPIKNRSVKPYGGLWSSSYKKDRFFISDWFDWCIYENFWTDKLDKGVIFDFKPNTKIYTIDKHNDLLKILKEVGSFSIFPQDEKFIKNIENVFDSPIDLPLLDAYIDFEEASKKYDVIHLTKNGQAETRLSSINLYGWDVESCLIMNFDCIDLNSIETISEKEGSILSANIVLIAKNILDIIDKYRYKTNFSDVIDETSQLYSIEDLERLSKNNFEDLSNECKSYVLLKTELFNNIIDNNEYEFTDTYTRFVKRFLLHYNINKTAKLKLLDKNDFILLKNEFRKFEDYITNI